MNSFNEKTIASENLSIRVMQVPQYAGGLSDVSNANFISPLKNNKADSIPSLNIFSQNGTKLQSFNNTFDINRSNFQPQGREQIKSHLSSPNVGSASVTNNETLNASRSNIHRDF